MPAVKAILFDADGVIQRPGADFRASCAAILGQRAIELDRFMQVLFAMVKPALTGRRDFVADVQHFLSGYDLAQRVPEVLSIWTTIETDAPMLAEIAALRARGVTCCLATNQQRLRGGYMSETLGYRALFDHEFYSHALGFAKPDPDYFRAIAARLAVEPSELLFIDDHEPNVLGAREAGLHAETFPHAPASSTAALHAILARHGLRPG
jgi:putative hydrolase of the HAD superfamily